MRDAQPGAFLGWNSRQALTTSSWFTFWHIDYLHILVFSYVKLLFSIIKEFT